MENREENNIATEPTQPAQPVQQTQPVQTVQQTQTAQPETTGATNGNKYFKWIENMNPQVLAGLVVLVIIVFVGVILFYLDSSEIGLFDKQEQPTGQYLDLTNEEKEDILSSLSGSSDSVDVPREEKHNELDQLSEQSKDNPQLRDFEKVEILNRLNQ